MSGCREKQGRVLFPLRGPIGQATAVTMTVLVANCMMLFGAHAATQKTAPLTKPKTYPMIQDVYVAFRVLGGNDQFPNDQSHVVVKAMVKATYDGQTLVFGDLGSPPSGEANWNQGNTWHVYGQQGPDCPTNWPQDYMRSLYDLDQTHFGTVTQWKTQYWGTPTFVWSKVSHLCTAKCASGGDYGADRKYDYDKTQTPPWSGWGTANTGVTLPAGLMRYRVKVYYRSQGEKISADEECATRIPVKTSQNFGIADDAGEDAVRRREYLRWLYMYRDEPYEYGGHWFGGTSSPDTCVGSSDYYDRYGMDCSGLVSNGARWAGYNWSTWRQTTRGLPSVSTEVGAAYVAPGHILNRYGHHVRSIWRVDSSGSNTVVQWIASEGAPDNCICEGWSILNDDLQGGYTLRRLEPQ